MSFSSFRAALVAAAVLSASVTQGETFQSRDEALAEAFPGADMKRETTYLTKAQLDRAAALAGEAIPHEVVYRYAAYRDGELTGTAYFDAHKVRTLSEVLMVVVAPSGELENVKVLVFKEPREYLASKRWYRQFIRKKLDSGLGLHRDIQGVSGATLTARATVNAARRILAVHQVISKGDTP